MIYRFTRGVCGLGSGATAIKFRHSHVFVNVADEYRYFRGKINAAMFEVTLSLLIMTIDNTISKLEVNQSILSEYGCFFLYLACIFRKVSIGTLLCLFLRSGYFAEQCGFLIQRVIEYFPYH